MTIGVLDWRNKSSDELMRPIKKPVAVTPSDAVDLADGWCSAFCIAVAGAVKITDILGNDVTLTLPAGWHPVGARRIWAAGTTATGITAGYN